MSQTPARPTNDEVPSPILTPVPSSHASPSKLHLQATATPEQVSPARAVQLTCSNVSESVVS